LNGHRAQRDRRRRCGGDRAARQHTHGFALVWLFRSTADQRSI
jgi:hypothetical protein